MLFLAIAVALAPACSKKRDNPLVGVWSVTVRSDDVGQIRLEVDIKDDGTYELTGDRTFQVMTGSAKVAGTYDWDSDTLLTVDMERNDLDYPVTTYHVEFGEDDEIALITHDYTVYLKPS